ncbi:MAG TPA: hypothetical protein VJG85_02590 [Patescibacteria group bacterium]|nr:hypothetical protein [Patescibacteria group bacterium]
MPRKPQNKYNRITQRATNPVRPPALHQLSEEELVQHLMKTIMGIVLFLIVVLGTLLFFAPKLGAFFGLLSFRRDEVTKLEVAPIAPVFSNVPGSTNNENLTINGFSEPGMTIKLFLNGPESQSTVTDNEGFFTFADIKLINGTNTIFSKAVNETGKESENSQIVTIVYDNTAPEITIESPKNGAVVKNLDKRILVKGKLSEKATVKVNNSLAVLTPDNNFEIVLGVESGKLEIKVEATDEAGNKKEEKINITYVKGS